MLGTTIGDLYGLPLGKYYGSDLGSSECFDDGNTNEKFEGLLLGASIGSVTPLKEIDIAALVSRLSAASKAHYSANITAHDFSSIARSAATMVGILRLSQKRDVRGVMYVSVYELIFKRPTPENSVAVLEHKSLDENNACACRPPFLPLKWDIMPATLVFGVDIVGSTRHSHGVDVWWCWVSCN